MYRKPHWLAAIMKISAIITSLLILTYVSTGAQNTGKISGLLLLSPERNCTSFDLFLPCKIDTLKTLRDNLIKLKHDTAFHSFNSDFGLISKAEKIRNQSFDSNYAYDLKFCLVIPVTAEHDTNSEKLFKNIETDDIHRMPYIFYGTTITEYYRTKYAYLKSIKVVRLPTNKGG
jgi:hypothetical protein